MGIGERKLGRSQDKKENKIKKEKKKDERKG